MPWGGGGLKAGKFGTQLSCKHGVLLEIAAENRITVKLIHYAERQHSE